MIRPISHAVAKINLNNASPKGLTKNVVKEVPQGLTKKAIRYDDPDASETCATLGGGSVFTTLEYLGFTLTSMA